MKLFTNIIFFTILGSFGFSKEKFPDIWDKLMNHKEWEHVKETEKYQLSKSIFDEYSIPAIKIEMILKAHRN